MAFASHVARVRADEENMDQDTDDSGDVQACIEANPLYDHPKVRPHEY